jgi:uncharacterized protein YqfA (UPF0365 family)
MTSESPLTNLTLAQNPPPLLMWVVFVIILLVALSMIVVFARYFRLWLQAFLARAPIPFFQLIGMKLRRSPVAEVVRLRIMAVQGGVDIPTHEIERAYLQGADAERAVRAMIRAKELGQEVTWQELLSTDLEMWLAERDKPR